MTISREWRLYVHFELMTQTNVRLLTASTFIILYICVWYIRAIIYIQFGRKERGCAFDISGGKTTWLGEFLAIFNGKEVMNQSFRNFKHILI